MKPKALGAALAIVAIVTLAGCGSEGGTDATTLKATTCADLIPSVINISTQSDGSKLVAIYKPTLVKDQINDFNSGALKIPSGKNEVVVLTCKGQGSWSDQTQDNLLYSESVDVNNQVFVEFNEVK